MPGAALVAGPSTSARTPLALFYLILEINAPAGPASPYFGGFLSRGSCKPTPPRLLQNRYPSGRGAHPTRFLGSPVPITFIWSRWR